jgi:hypothetical protein
MSLRSTSLVVALGVNLAARTIANEFFKGAVAEVEHVSAGHAKKLFELSLFSVRQTGML